MVSSVAFHPTGTIIASASTDKSIKLFDIRTHKLIQHYGDAHGVAHSDQFDSRLVFLMSRVSNPKLTKLKLR